MWLDDRPQIWFTYGPAVDSEETLQGLFAAGATGVRLTFSYGTPELQHERAARVQLAARATGHRPFIVADLEGEKPRLAKIDDIPEQVTVNRGEVFRICRFPVASGYGESQMALRNPDHFEMFGIGDLVLVGDGAVVFKVIEAATDSLLCSTLRPGRLNAGRGLAVQSPKYRPTALGRKDIADLEEVSRNLHLYDAVALSFVAGPEDLDLARVICAHTKSSLPFIAKIETLLGLARLESICTRTQAILVARGDLALSSPWLDLYSHCKRIIEVARSHKLPWIVATQLAEGLDRFEFPTRAEICDLAHWSEVGASGAMLSYETAFGPRPIDAVAAVKQILSRYADTDCDHDGR